MKLSKKFGIPVVYVEWIDSATRVGWARVDRDMSVCRIRSVGLLVKQNKHAITISSCLDESGIVNHAMSIPRCAVRKMRRIG